MCKQTELKTTQLYETNISLYVYNHVIKTNWRKNFNLADEYVALGKKHPFINSPLGDYMDHLKGNRKLDGKSKLEDIKEGRRGEKQKYDYWKT